jgi:hypothetical protein
MVDVEMTLAARIAVVAMRTALTVAAARPPDRVGRRP